MRKSIALSLMAGILLVTMLCNVSAYWEYRTYYDDCAAYGDCEGTHYGTDCIYGFNGNYCRDYDYNTYPRYGHYDVHYYGCDDHWYNNDEEDCEFRAKALVAIRGATVDYNNWVVDTYYSNSEDLYGSSGNTDVSSTNWRYKQAYNNVDSWNGGYYYAPVYDSEKGYFNWRY